VPWIEVVRPGLLTTVQDLGRWGWQAWGVSVSGPMDRRAHRAANGLIGNPPDAATLEITFVGPELLFDDDRTVAVCGADFILTIGNHLAASGKAFRVPRGGRLRFGGHRRGTRAYLAVEGGIAVDPVFGSRATHLPSRLGGYEGRALVAGDRMPLGASAVNQPGRPSTLPLDVPNGRARLRVLPAAAHADRFERDALTHLQSQPYTIRHESDRMGYRLEGRRVRALSGGDQLSEPSPPGSLQIPPSGDPILLMADCQTMGGYPVVGTVISADLGLAGQLGPGDVITFTACSRQEAVAALIAQERSLMTIR
jgi:biotin-dependent carboxylase-like uncharacterized protein